MNAGAGATSVDLSAALPPYVDPAGAQRVQPQCMTPEQRAATIATVAATMRQVAGWGLAFDNGPACDELRSIADQVELLSSSGDDMCCPMCEEVDCDEDCPLSGVRAGN